MSSLPKLVLLSHDSSLFSSSFVMHLAVSRGLDVKRETTTKDIMILSGSGFLSLILVRRAYNVVNCMKYCFDKKMKNYRRIFE